jgi:hypothetical protein
VTQQPSNTTASVSQFSSTAFSLPTGSWEGISFAGGKWFATPNNRDFGGDYIATSSDGITWTKQLVALPVPARWSRVVYYDGIYLTHLMPLPSSGTQYATSTDGVTWTARRSSNIPAASDPVVVSMPGIGFVLLTQEATSTGAAYSSDGVTWTPAWGGTGSYPAQSGSRVISVLGGVYNSATQLLEYKIGTQVSLGQSVYSTVVSVGNQVAFSLTRIDVLAENYFAVYGQYLNQSVIYLLSYADANATTPTVTESNLPGSTYDMAVAVAGSRLVAAGSLGFYTSADGGGTWALRQSAALYSGGSGQTSGRFFVSGSRVTYVPTGNAANRTIYTSDNQGLSWMERTFSSSAAGDYRSQPFAGAEKVVYESLTATSSNGGSLIDTGGLMSASFSSAATTTFGNPAIQWQQSSDGGATWTNISAATSSSLSLNPVSGDNGKRYRAVYSKDSYTTVNSNSATLTVP